MSCTATKALSAKDRRWDRAGGICRLPERSHESGYIMAQAALLIIPLLLFSAFATDLGFWYIQGQRAQRAADSAALAGVTYLPDVPLAMQEARNVAEKNGYTDATPGNNDDFETGPLPQVRVTNPRPGTIEVQVRKAERAFLSQVVLDGITVERFAVADFAAPVHLGNPTSGLGTGNIPESELGMPGDKTWLALNAYCMDKANGDHFMAGFYDGPYRFGSHFQCEGEGPRPHSKVNPNFDNDAYTFVTELQPGSPSVDISIYEPGHGCTEPGSTGDKVREDLIPASLHWRLYGPSMSFDHNTYLDTHLPVASGSFGYDECIDNSPNGDGWWPVKKNLPPPAGNNGGFYYLRVNSANPVINNGADYWKENETSRFSMKVTKSGQTKLCTFGAADETCPQLYALDWLPLFRDAPSSEAEFFLAEIPEYHAGNTLAITFFDAAEGIDNLQFATPDGTAMAFTYRYVDKTVGKMTSPEYIESAFPIPSYRTCSFRGTYGNPCLDTRIGDYMEDHMIEVSIEIPPAYTCGGDCWWKVRYITGGIPRDRTNWTIQLKGDPVQLVE